MRILVSLLSEDGRLIFVPVNVWNRKSRFPQQDPGFALKPDRQWPSGSLQFASKEGKVIFLAFPDYHSVETIILKAHPFPAGIRLKDYVMRVVLVQRSFVIHQHRTDSAPAHNQLPSGKRIPPLVIAFLILKRAILDQFSIEPSIRGVIKVFKEDPEEIGTDPFAGLVQLDTQGGCFRLRAQKQTGKQRSEESFHGG